ncbi:MAG: STN domain-containing protein [Kordiimonadaceae bacterium]|nr:STN domain-containing protein [Kordiimonadaceae bacterium]
MNNKSQLISKGNRALKESRLKLLGAASLLVLGAAFTNVQASEDLQSRFLFELESQPLAEALVRYSKMTDVVVTVQADLLWGKTSPAINAKMSAKEALTYLLQNTQLAVIERNDGSITILPPRASGFQKIGFASTKEYEAGLVVYPDDEEMDDIDGDTVFEEIVVTGSHIRGVRSASPVFVYGRKDIDLTGVSTAPIHPNPPAKFRGWCY